MGLVLGVSLAESPGDDAPALLGSLFVGVATGYSFSRFQNSCGSVSVFRVQYHVRAGRDPSAAVWESGRLIWKSGQERRAQDRVRKHGGLGGRTS